MKFFCHKFKNIFKDLDSQKRTDYASSKSHDMLVIKVRTKTAGNDIIKTDIWQKNSVLT